MITPRQIQMARNLVGITQIELAEKVGIHQKTISRIENGLSPGGNRVLKKIKDALELMGAEFIEPEGVNRKVSNVITLQGKSGFHSFLDDVYKTIKDGGEINVANVNEDHFIKWADEKHEIHMERIKEIKNLTCRCLIIENDQFEKLDYSQYRTLPKEMCGPVPFYLYGEKLALIQFEPEPLIFIIDAPLIAETYRAQFLSIWENAK